MAHFSSSQETLLDAIADQIEALLPEPGVSQRMIGQLRLIRRDAEQLRCDVVSRPSVSIVAAGGKEALLLGRPCTYGRGAVFVSSVDVPDSFRVIPSSDGRPFLALSLAFEPELVERSLARFPKDPDRSASRCGSPASSGANRAVSIFPADAGLLDAFLRLLETALAVQQDSQNGGLKALSSVIEEEICVRMLSSPGARSMQALFQLTTAESRIRRSALWMRAHYRDDFRMEAAAQDAGMSPASFYAHFKSVMGLTPRRYIKMLRLFEAKRLMGEEGRSALEAALEVGFESASHFSREFAKEFGEAPGSWAKNARAS